MVIFVIKLLLLLFLKSVKQMKFVFNLKNTKLNSKVKMNILLKEKSIRNLKVHLDIEFIKHINNTYNSLFNSINQKAI